MKYGGISKWENPVLWALSRRDELAMVMPATALDGILQHTGKDWAAAKQAEVKACLDEGSEIANKLFGGGLADMLNSSVATTINKGCFWMLACSCA